MLVYSYNDSYYVKEAGQVPGVACRLRANVLTVLALLALLQC